MVRAWVACAWGLAVVPGLSSNKTHDTPRRPSSIASVSPAGPPPAITTSTCRLATSALLRWYRKRRGNVVFLRGVVLSCAPNPCISTSTARLIEFGVPAPATVLADPWFPATHPEKCARERTVPSTKSRRRAVRRLRSNDGLDCRGGARAVRARGRRAGPVPARGPGRSAGRRLPRLAGAAAPGDCALASRVRTIGAAGLARQRGGYRPHISGAHGPARARPR